MGRSFRGGQHQLLLLIETLRDAGHENTLLVRADSPIAEEAHARGAMVKLASPFAMQRFSSSHDIVHAHDAHAHSLAAVFARKPFVVSRRVAFPISRSPLSKIKYRRAARYLAVSKYVSQKLIDVGVEQSKIDIVHDAVAIRTEMQVWSADAPVIALASSDPMKGRDLVEQAAQILRIPVIFSSDLPTHFQHASAFIYISRSEGFGSAALLAMSMGVPVIASRIEGMMEVFEDGVSGIFVDNDPGAIVAGIRRVVENPALAESLIEQARKRVETFFNPNVLLNKTLDSYRRALGAG